MTSVVDTFRAPEKVPHSVERRDVGINRAVIVEPRNHRALRAVVQNVCAHTSLPITLYHGTRNDTLARDVARECACVDTLVNMGVANLTWDQYQGTLKDRAFWDRVDADKVLVFQTDSGICEDSDATIGDFDPYDYCGALWAAGNVRKGKSVGNGGFSVRSVRAMRSLSGESALPEDVHFSLGCEASAACTMCPESVAERFATELVASGPGVRPFGFHKPFGFSKAMKTCPFSAEVGRLQ